MENNDQNIIRKAIHLFIEKVSQNEIDIYNEFSLQHELGIVIRNHTNGLKVQFERNISYFNLENNNFVKKEIDISIFHENELVCCIELKYPKNGQYPEQMFSFCKDIKFMEQVKRAGFKKTFVIIFADDECFYNPKNSSKIIYGYFRNRLRLTGKVTKPTGSKKEELFIKGSYTIVWNDIKDSLKYTIVEIQ